MIIYTSDKIKQDYNTISEECKKTKEPIYLTNNGEVDLVVMDIESFYRREKTLRIREELLSVEEDRMNKTKDISIDELDKRLDLLIEEL